MNLVVVVSRIFWYDGVTLFGKKAKVLKCSEVHIVPKSCGEIERERRYIVKERERERSWDDILTGVTENARE